MVGEARSGPSLGDCANPTARWQTVPPGGTIFSSPFGDVDMTRLLGVLTALVVFAPVAFTAPVPKALKTKAPDVTGTVWISDENEVKLGVLEYTFHEGGKLTWQQQGSQHTNTAGSWKQDGDHLYWEVNQRYVDYNTDFKGGKFEGGALNKVNKRWTIALKPKAEEKK